MVKLMTYAVSVRVDFPVIIGFLLPLSFGFGYSDIGSGHCLGVLFMVESVFLWDLCVL